MKLLAGLLIFISSIAFGYQEKIEVSGNQTGAQMVSMGEPSITAFGPIRGYFYAATENYQTAGNCDDFINKVHKFIRDWNQYPHMNMYSLVYCSAVSGKAQSEFIYAIDLWDPNGVTSQKKFLKDHQGLEFLEHKLDFSVVTSLDAKSVLTLAKMTGDKLTKVYEANHSLPYQYEDEWYPHHLESINSIQQSKKDVFLKYVETEYGASEKGPFEKLLPSSDFVAFSDFFTLYLENGKVAHFWLGFGSNKNCGTQPCYTNSMSR